MINLSEVFKSSEKVNLEVKAAQGGVPNSIWETYSSFANTFGGTIILGIGEDKNTGKFIPVGVENPQKMQSDIWNVLNNRQKISANILLEDMVYPLEYEGHDYIVIEVPRADRRDRPIFVGTDMFKGSFKRNHEGDYHCTEAEIKAMIRDSLETSADSTVLDNVAMEALNSDSIKSYRSRFEMIRSGHTWNALPNDEFLIKIGAARVAEYDGKIHPTLGGLIFFGDFINIMNELPSFFLDYREKLLSDTRWSDRVSSGDGDWSGNVYDFYFKIVDRLTSDVKKPFVINKNLLREDDTDIHKSLREALANALIHADYYGRCGIVIEKEFRKIKFSNPGTFRISVDDAISGGISDARNSRIFNMFTLIKVGERSGMGLCDIFNHWDEYGYEKPIIKETINPDRTTLFLSIEYENNHGANDDIGANHGANRGANDDFGANRGANDNIDVIETSIIEYLKNAPNASSNVIANALSIPLRTVQRSLRNMQTRGIIRNAGSRKKSIWVIENKS